MSFFSFVVARRHSSFCAMVRRIYSIARTSFTAARVFSKHCKRPCKASAL